MKLRKYIVIVLLMVAFSPFVFCATEDSTSYGIFGKIWIYKGIEPPASVVLFISGDGGWNEGVVDMARILSSMNSLVVGVDIVHYYAALKKSDQECYYPASDFERLSIFIQRKYNLPAYQKPILAGYSSGATLVYALLCQAPGNTFRGGISLGFCPDIEITKPLCVGSGLKSRILSPGKSFYLSEDNELPSPLVVLQGMIDQVCSHDEAVGYFKDTKNATIISLPEVGHGFSVQKNWVPQFKEAFKLVNETVPFDSQKQDPSPGNKSEALSLEDLPLSLYPDVSERGQPMVLMITGDGGMTSWDKSLCEEFVSKGMPVIALDAQSYFWKEKTPAQTTRDVENILEWYLSAWKRDQFILVGYSFGGDIVPFIASRLSPALAMQLKKTVLISPDPLASFEIHISDMLNLGNADDTFNVVAEIRKIKSPNITCLFGEAEDKTDMEPFQLPGVKLLTLPGSHHFGNNFPGIVSAILTP